MCGCGWILELSYHIWISPTMPQGLFLRSTLLQSNKTISQLTSSISMWRYPTAILTALCFASCVTSAKGELLCYFLFILVLETLARPKKRVTKSRKCQQELQLETFTRIRSIATQQGSQLSYHQDQWEHLRARASILLAPILINHSTLLSFPYSHSCSYTSARTRGI